MGEIREDFDSEKLYFFIFKFICFKIQPPWRIIFPFTIWLLWESRNASIFRNQHVHPYVHNEALFRALEFQHCDLNAKKLSNKRLVQVRWERPQAGGVCLNTDGDRTSVV